MYMKNYLNKDSLLSKSDIEKLRKAYNNYKISEDYLNFEVKNLMVYEKISKEDAIRHILKIILD